MHRHYSFWVQNTGAIARNDTFGLDQLKALDNQLHAHVPTGRYVYPLQHQGERFPFNNSLAKKFEIGAFSSEAQRYAAHVEGLCFVEHMMLDVFEELGMKLGSRVFSVGGATKVISWMQLRSTILDREILVRAVPEAAFGCALLVGCKAEFACPALIKIHNTYSPNDQLVDKYRSAYEEFKRIVQEKIETEWA